MDVTHRVQQHAWCQSCATARRTRGQAFSQQGVTTRHGHPSRIAAPQASLCTCQLRVTAPGRALQVHRGHHVNPPALPLPSLSPVVVLAGPHTLEGLQGQLPALLTLRHRDFGRLELRGQLFTQLTGHLGEEGGEAGVCEWMCGQEALRCASPPSSAACAGQEQALRKQTHCCSPAP